MNSAPPPSIPQPEPPEPAGPSRRNLILGLATAAFAGAAGTRALINSVRDESAQATSTITVESAIPREYLALPLPDFWLRLQKEFPQLQADPYALFTLEHEMAYWFLSRASLEDLINLRILKGTEPPHSYMDIQKCWDTACRRKGPAAAEYRTKALRAPREKVSLDAILAAARRAITHFQKAVLKPTKLENDFSQYIAPEVLLALCVQEIAPGELPGKIKIKPKARLELFRMMCDAGWQPQKMPAMFDSAVSFGLGQMTLPTHTGLQRAYHEETADCIEKDFLDHFSIRQQLNTMLLLSYANLEAFSRLAAKSPKFLSAFAAASDENKKRFVTTVLAAYHNYGNRSSLRKRITSVLAEKYDSLEKFRAAFLEGLSGLTIAYNHARNSGALYSFVAHRAETHAALPPSDPDIADAPDATPPEQNDVREDTLLVRISKKTPYYTFTVPPIRDLSEALHGIFAPGKNLDDVKKFQGVTRYGPGAIIHIPLAYVREELRDRRMCIVDTTGTNLGAALATHAEGGDTETNRFISLLYGSRDGKELRFPAGLCKD